ncbi:MAG: tetratricopeptide repeat protein [bacterium]
MKIIFIAIIIIILSIGGILLWETWPKPITDYDTASNKAFEYNLEGNYKKAIEYFLLAAKLDDQKRYAPYRNVAVLYRDLHEFDKAEEYYTKVIEMEPRGQFVVEIMDLYIYDLKKPEEDIIATFEYFMANIHDNRAIAFRYALYLESVNRYQDALNLYKVILGTEPDNQSLKESIDYLKMKLDKNQ